MKKLRENNEPVLHGACMDLNDIEFTGDAINITIEDEATFALLNKYKETLNQYAGNPIINILRGKKIKADVNKINRLKAVLGDILTVEET